MGHPQPTRSETDGGVRQGRDLSTTRAVRFARRHASLKMTARGVSASVYLDGLRGAEGCALPRAFGQWGDARD
jgi:hypothetical protein